MTVISRRAEDAAREHAVVAEFFTTYRTAADATEVVADLTFGNPHEMALPALVDGIRTAMEPQTVDWFAYKTSEEEPRGVIARALSDELSLDFAPEDIHLTQGAFGAIALAFTILMDAGDECIIAVPGWFCYGNCLALRGAVPVPVSLAEDSYDLDLDAIEAAITPRTRIVVVNTPHNPTGIIYSRAHLAELGEMLARKSAENGRPIFILSDEPYRRIRFDGAGFTSPAEVYPHTLIDYSYGKILLAPGLRLGYLALSPLMPAGDRAALQQMMLSTQVAHGWGFPDAPLQYAVGALERVAIDLDGYQQKRDRMHGALAQWGYDMTKPAGTFYLWGRAPGGDAEAFTARLADQGVFVMPGTLFDRPADFRICLTATPEMIEAALPAFEAARP